MKLVLTLSLWSVLAGAAAGEEQEPTPPAAAPLTVAVFDFPTADGLDRELGAQVSLLLTSLLSVEDGLILVERAELAKVLGEQELGLSGTVSSDTRARVGYLTGARVLVTGRAFSLGKELMLVAKIISSETSRVFGEAVRVPLDSSLGDAATELAGKVAATLAKQASALVPPVPAAKDRLVALEKLVKGKTLPALSIHIPEHDADRRAPALDPAAQTELERILGALGFPLVDAASTTKPAPIRVTGEAFAEQGMTRGNLVSCLGRVEVRAVRDGKVLFSGRESRVAVDLGRESAGKQALEAAAAELADRLVRALLAPE